MWHDGVMVGDSLFIVYWRLWFKFWYWSKMRFLCSQIVRKVFCPNQVYFFLWRSIKLWIISILLNGLVNYFDKCHSSHYYYVINNNVFFSVGYFLVYLKTNRCWLCQLHIQKYWLSTWQHTWEILHLFASILMIFHFLVSSLFN